MKPSRTLVEVAAAALLAAALFAGGFFLPVIGPPAGFLATAPLAWAAWRGGALPGFLCAALATALCLPVLPPPAVLVFAVEHGLAGWLLGLLLGRGLFRAAATASVVSAALLLGGAMLISGTAGVDPFEAFESQVRAALGEMAGQGVDAEKLVREFEPLLARMRRVFPALTLVGLFLECAVNGLLALRVLAQHPPSGRAPPRLPALAGFALPEATVWALIPALALAWSPWPVAATVAANVALPLLGLYLLQGLSILAHFADRARLSRLVRALFAAALVFQPYLLAVPLLLGLVDFRFGFRRRWPVGPPAA